MKIKLRGIFLTSENAKKTAQFYKIVAKLKLKEVGNPSDCLYWRAESDGVQLTIHDAKMFAEYTSPVNYQSNVTHLYFKIDSQIKFMAHLKKLNIIPFSADEIVITVLDPDERKVMFGIA